MSQPERKQLARSRSNRKLTGLAGGLAAYFDVDPSLVRLGILALIIVSGVVPGILAYAIAAMVTPEEGTAIRMQFRLRRPDAAQGRV